MSFGETGPQPEPDRGRREVPPAGLAHVATASFLASRAAPSAGFWVALAGGVALARTAALRGLRIGYGASVASMLQTVAIMGPARFGVPLTQALTAPLLGRLDARGASVVRQVLACGAIRLVQNALFVAFFVLVLAGGIDTYTEGYDAIASRLPFVPEGTEAALMATAAGLVGWAIFGSTVQVLVYRRGLRSWPTDVPAEPPRPSEDVELSGARRFDPRAIGFAAAIAFCILLASTAWPVLAAVAIWLAVVWTISRGDADVVPVGAAIALLLAGGVLTATLIGGLGLDHALRRATRAGLLVMVATWLRSAAGLSGMREVSRRLLGRLRRLPSAREAAVILDELGSGRQLGAAARSLLDALRPAPRRPMPVLDAVLGWVAAEAARFRAAAPAPGPPLAARAGDGALVALAVTPGLLLVLG